MSNFDLAKDTAQQMVTARLHGDSDVAADLLREYLEKDRAHRLILVLVDLTVHTHMSWAHAIDMSPERAREAWADLMSDIEEWRTSNEEP